MVRTFKFWNAGLAIFTWDGKQLFAFITIILYLRSV